MPLLIVIIDKLIIRPSISCPFIESLVAFLKIAIQPAGKPVLLIEPRIISLLTESVVASRLRPLRFPGGFYVVCVQEPERSVFPGPLVQPVYEINVPSGVYGNPRRRTVHPDSISQRDSRGCGIWILEHDA